MTLSVLGRSALLRKPVFSRWPTHDVTRTHKGKIIPQSAGQTKDRVLMVHLFGSRFDIATLRKPQNYYLLRFDEVSERRFYNY